MKSDIGLDGDAAADVDTESEPSAAQDWLIHPKTKQQLFRHTANALTLVAVVVIMFPIYWMAAIALRPNSELFLNPQPLVYTDISLEGFRKVFDPTQSNIIRYYTNSLIVTIGLVILNTVVSTVSGWGLTRLEIPYKRYFARTILFGYMFPPILLSIPIFIVWIEVDLTNTYHGLVFAMLAVVLPFSVWLMWQFFQTVPYSLEESAMMAGASRFRAFYEIALPQAKPGIIAVAIYTYAVGWSAFTMPKIINFSNDMWVTTVGLQDFLSGYTIDWAAMMAACTVYILPVFLFLFTFQKYLLKGFRTAR